MSLTSCNWHRPDPQSSSWSREGKQWTLSNNILPIVMQCVNRITHILKESDVTTAVKIFPTTSRCTAHKMVFTLNRRKLMQQKTTALSKDLCKIIEPEQKFSFSHPTCHKTSVVRQCFTQTGWEIERPAHASRERYPSCNRNWTWKLIIRRSFLSVKKDSRSSPDWTPSKVKRSFLDPNFLDSLVWDATQT